MRQNQIVIGQTYRNRSVQFKKWWHRTVVAIGPNKYDSTKVDVTFIQHYGERDHNGKWRQETTRRTSFARWAQEMCDLPAELEK